MALPTWGRAKSKQSRDGSRSSGSRYQVLAHLENERTVVSPDTTAVTSPAKSRRDVFNGVIREASQVYTKLHKMLVDGSLDAESRKQISSEADSLTEEVMRFRSGPTSPKMVALTGRIQRLKGIYLTKMSPASFKAVSGGASDVPESVSEEVDLEVENKLGADDDSGMGDCGATQGGCENRCKKSGIDVDEGNGIETPTSGIDEVDEAKNEEENRVEGLGTNACPEVAADAGFEPLNQTSKLDYASELNDFAVDVYGVEKGVMPLRSEFQIANKPDKFCDAHNLFDKLPKPNLSKINATRQMPVIGGRSKSWAEIVAEPHSGLGDLSKADGVEEVPREGEARVSYSTEQGESLSTPLTAGRDNVDSFYPCNDVSVNIVNPVCMNGGESRILAGECMKQVEEIEVFSGIDLHVLDKMSEPSSKAHTEVPTVLFVGKSQTSDAVPPESMLGKSEGMQSWVDKGGNNGIFANQPKTLGLESNCSRSGTDLEFFESSNNCSGIIDIEEDMVDEDPWIYCIVGYFLGYDMPFGLVRAT
ncbi:hypothetical protein U1Q18_013872, partial [Sarracenia purpurea var. burkii]